MDKKEYIERGTVLEIVKRTNGDYAAAFAEISRLPTAAETEVMACAESNLKYANDSLEILRQIREKVSSSAADVVEVRHGEWIDKRTGAYGRMQSWCTACGKHSGIGGIESNRHKPYCPNCGAKMDGGKEATP